MKLAAIVVAMAVMAGASAGAQAAGVQNVVVQSKVKSGTRREVVVYFVDHADVPSRVTVQEAQALASRMFADIGVHLDWWASTPPRQVAGAIFIELVTGTPVTFQPGALGYALPFEGIHIRVFWDRINVYRLPRQVLAHVMVHEITHILQGISGHADEGASPPPSRFSMASDSRHGCFEGLGGHENGHDLEPRGLLGVGLPVGCWLCFVKRWGVAGIWDGLWLALLLTGIGLVLALRIRSSDQKIT